MMSGIMSLLVAAFGVVWTLVAASMGGGIFALFGVIFIIMAIVQAVYNFKNAGSENRYSAFDIVDGEEEPDPLNRRFSSDFDSEYTPSYTEDALFCPYCGKRTKADHSFCAYCGKELE